MRLAVLGTDPDILALITAAKSQGHDIPWLGDVRPADAAALARLVPGVRADATEWETLLDHATADAVLVGRGMATAELRAEQLKRLVTDAIPILVVHPACESVLTYYEIDMIRRETRGLVEHYNPVVSHPIVETLANWVMLPAGQESSTLPQIAPIHQIGVDRYAGDTGREAVLGHLTRDAELIAAIAAQIRRVSALGPQLDDDSYASLQVQLAASSVPSIRWSVTPRGSGDLGVRVAFIGERGTVALRITESTGNDSTVPSIVAQLDDVERKESTLRSFDAPGAAIERLARAVAEKNPELRSNYSTWDRATQSMEVVDAIQLSLQKGRTMEVHKQQLTEQLAFRGTMAAMGCGLLLVGFAALVFATLVGGVETFGYKKLISAWPIVLLAVLAAFLLLQALPFLIPKTRPARSRPDDHPPTT